jgi:hypothetical protein
MRLIESQKLRFFWKEFGLTKFDLARCTQEWLEDMWMVHLGIEKVKSNVNSSGATSKSSGAFKNKRVEKLL